MESIQRFNVMVLTATLIVMFCVIRYVVPYLELTNFPAIISGYLTFISAAHITEAIKDILTAVTSIGSYKLIAAGLSASVDRIPPFKSFIFGASYVHGTWAGSFLASGDPKWTIEHFEQSLSGVVIRGWALNNDGTVYAMWVSNTVSIDIARGTLTYTYVCDVYSKSMTQQGIGVFHFVRSKPWSAPASMTGYSADLTDGKRSENHEYKVSASLMTIDLALPYAKTPALISRGILARGLSAVKLLWFRVFH